MNYIYDLDGTLCKVNTYKVFLFMLMVFMILTFQLGLLTNFYLILHRRLIKKSSRTEMKIRAFEVYSNVYFRKSFNTILVNVLLLFVRKELLEVVDVKGRKILATAAYEFYSAEVAEKLGFDKCIATTEEDLKCNKECIGELKKERVFEEINHESIDVFFTDHKDDIPLIKISNKVYLIKPSKHSRIAIENLQLPTIDLTYA